MKLRTMALVVCSVGVLAAAGCKKKPKEGKAPPEGSGSAMAGSGSAGSGSAMAGSGSAGSGGAAAPEAKLEGKALADKYLECTGYLNDKKYDDFKGKCVAADYKGHQMDGEDVTGVDALIEMFKTQAAAFPDMKIQPQLVMVSGRNIFGVGLMTGTHTGTLKTPMGEIPATNKKIGQLMFHRIAISDENRATEEWAYYDPSTMMGQLGLLPKEAPPMRPAIEKGWEGAPIVVVTADNDAEKKNLEAVKKSNDAFAAKKVADSMASYADDALESDQANEKDAKGKKDIQAGAEMFQKAFPDLKIDMPDMFAAGDYVVGQGTFSGTNTGPMGKMKPTKKAVTGHYAEVFKLKDGKITEVWRFRNGMAMAMQMGLIPEPKAGGAGGGSAAGSAAGGGSGAGSATAPKGGDKKDEKKDEKKKGGDKKDATKSG